MSERQDIDLEFSNVHLVQRREIPLSSAPEDAGLDVRPFLGHRILGSMMPPSGVTMAWTQTSPGDALSPRSHEAPGLLVVLRGGATLVGATRRLIQQGDVVTIPAGHEYGFVEAGAQGIHALHVSFGGQGATALAQEALSLDELLAANERRAAAVIAGPFFGLLVDGSLRSDRKRHLFLNCIRLFSNAFQSILFTRQAMCRDEEFATPFLEHLVEELGHNTLLAVPRSERAFTDPVLRATSSWFCHQMLVLDNLAKAVLVNLVLETAGYHFHTFATKSLGGTVYPEYFSAHSEEAEQGHKDGGTELLRNQPPETYRRLQRILDDGWNMFEAMTRRIADLVKLEAASS